MRLFAPLVMVVLLVYNSPLYAGKGKTDSQRIDESSFVIEDPSSKSNSGNRSRWQSVKNSVVKGTLIVGGVATVACLSFVGGRYSNDCDGHKSPMDYEVYGPRLPNGTMW